MRLRLVEPHHPRWHVHREHGAVVRGRYRPTASRRLAKSFQCIPLAELESIEGGVHFLVPLVGPRALRELGEPALVQVKIALPAATDENVTAIPKSFPVLLVGSPVRLHRASRLGQPRLQRLRLVT